MSKRSPDKVFLVKNDAGVSVHVVARHPKGARSVASDYLDGVTPNCHVEEAPPKLKSRAVNAKGKRS